MSQPFQNFQTTPISAFSSAGPSSIEKDIINAITTLNTEMRIGFNDLIFNQRNLGNAVKDLDTTVKGLDTTVKGMKDMMLYQELRNVSRISNSRCTDLYQRIEPIFTNEGTLPMSFPITISDMIDLPHQDVTELLIQYNLFEIHKDLNHQDRKVQLAKFFGISLEYHDIDGSLTFFLIFN